MLGTMYRWCVAAFNNGLWNIPTPVDQVLDDRIVQMQVKIDALCEQQWPPEQHPRKKSEHMLYLLCYQGQLGTICLQEDSDHMCLWPGYHLHHDTAKHGHPGIMKESTGEWNRALLSSVMRVGFVCLRVMDVHVFGVDLVSVIFLSTIVFKKNGPTRGGHKSKFQREVHKSKLNAFESNARLRCLFRLIL